MHTYPQDTNIDIFPNPKSFYVCILCVYLIYLHLTKSVSRFAPPSEALSAGVVALALGDYHTCGLLTGGGVYCWGGNTWGQLGTGDNSIMLTPTVVTGLGSGETCLML